MLEERYNASYLRDLLTFLDSADMQQAVDAYERLENEVRRVWKMVGKRARLGQGRSNFFAFGAAANPARSPSRRPEDRNECRLDLPHDGRQISSFGPLAIIQA